MRFPNKGQIVRRGSLPSGVPLYKNHIYLYKDEDNKIFLSSNSVKGIVTELTNKGVMVNDHFFMKIVEDDGSESITSNIKTVSYNQD